MKHLLAIILYAFAGCAALGLIPAAVLAATGRPRNLDAAVFAAVAAAFVISVLVASGWELMH